MIQSIANLGLQLLGVGTVLYLIGSVVFVIVGFYLAAKEKQRRDEWVKLL